MGPQSIEKNPALEEITGKEVTTIPQHSELGAGAEGDPGHGSTGC